MHAARDHQMVRLMMAAERQDAEEAERLDALRIVRLAGRHCYRRSVHRGARVYRPLARHIRSREMAPRHALNRCRDLGAASDSKARAVRQLLGRRFRPQRHIVHVDEVGSQSVNVHLGPIGVRISAQDRHRFGESGKSALPRFDRCGHSALLGSRWSGVRVTGRLQHRRGSKSDQCEDFCLRCDEMFCCRSRRAET